MAKLQMLIVNIIFFTLYLLFGSRQQKWWHVACYRN